MAKTAEQGRAKWERKTADAGSKWKEATSGAGGRWAEGLSQAGLPPGPQSRAAYESGIGATSASDFQASISGKGQKWLENTRRGLSR